MNTQYISALQRRLQFGRWSRKGYAVFSSLRAVVKICSLPVTYCLLALPVATFAQTDSVTVSKNVDISEVVVNAPRAASTYSELARAVVVISSEEIGRMAATSLNELLEVLASVDIRQRGAHSVQADLMVRGGSFDQVLVLLNGVNITDPQTGHHNLNIPIDLESIDRIELLQGPGARVYGPGAFSGAINIITKPPTNDQVDVGITVGQHNLIKTLASVGLASPRAQLLVAASTASSDGFTVNTDFRVTNIFAHGQINTRKGYLAFQSGYQDKGFGANSFYTPRFPNQYEATSTFITSAELKHQVRSFTINPSVYFRYHTDRFELFRQEAPDWYAGHNYHRTSVLGCKLDLVHTHSMGKFRLGTEFRQEGVLSNVLGDSLAAPIAVPGYRQALYTKGKTRNLLSIYGDKSLFLGPVSLSAGGLIAISDIYGVSYSYGADASYRVSQGIRPYLSYNHAIRYPTFTELYYSSRTNIGNPNLKPEIANTYELGMKLHGDFLGTNLAVFHRQGRNLIDWVRASSENPWETMNHTEINTTGAEGELLLTPPAWLPLINRVSLGYSHLFMEKVITPLQSYYTLDYLRSKATASVSHRLYRNFSASWGVVWQSRAGSYTHYPTGIEKEYEPFALINLKLAWEHGGTSLFAQASNLANRKHMDIANVPQPGRWVSVGFRHRM